MRFGINWDYRCPFARNMHEHLVTALQDGAGYEVEFIPFSLSQVHVEEGEPAVWADPTRHHELLAVMAGVVTRKLFPDRFYPTHLSLFSARHDQALDISDRETVAGVLDANGVPSSKVFAEIKSGWPLATFQEAHTRSVEEFHAFGVPTFFIGEQAAFVRVMTRPKGDAAAARRTIDRILETLTAYPELNEIKQTRIPR